MPRNVRNFFITGTVDGTKNPSLKGCGPRAKNGGFDLKIALRHRGVISDDYLAISGYESDGLLHLGVVLFEGNTRETLRICKQQ